MQSLPKKKKTWMNMQIVQKQNVKTVILYDKLYAKL